LDPGAPESARGRSFFPEETQARLIEVAATDWRDLTKAVADTHLAEPHLFESLARDAEHAQVKPYVGSLDAVSCEDEAVRLLIEALPYVATHPRNLPKRAKTLVTRVRAKAQSDPKDLPRAAIANLRRKN